jgi:NADPH-dependent 2,4-dienoyl-CoA reductase/sulfur reductase-like enzyme
MTDELKIETQTGMTNGSHIKQLPGEPLKVIVIGAGIGGLSAAAALRQAGHEVKVRTQRGSQYQ